MYNFTVTDLKNKFKHYNQKYFNGTLPDVRLYIDHTRKRLGCFHHRDKSISVSDYYARDERDINQTLVHEMIHLWQYQMFHTADHGKTFKVKAQEIKDVDGEFDITRLSDTTGVSARNSKKERVELLRFDWKGRTYCCRPCNGKGRYLMHRFSTSKEVTNMKLLSGYGEEFMTWDRCSTRIHCTLDITKSIDSFYSKYKIKEIA